MDARDAKKGFGDIVPERGLGPAAPTYPIIAKKNLLIGKTKKNQG